jgi:endonuclease/exonuclease/phosphatase (EEP) superfamily protein YafD
VPRVPRPTLRLLTANLWNGRADPDALAELIADAQPDAVLAQEMTPEHARAIEALLPYGVLLPRRDACGMGLALRRPARITVLRLPQRDALIARLSAPEWNAFGSPVEIVNVHVSAPTSLRQLWLRRAQVEALCAHVASTPMPRVIAGDFNMFRLMPAYRALCGRLCDAALQRRAFGQPTWSPRADWARWLRLDHVLTQGLQTTDLRVLRVHGSDHSALLATLAVTA